MYYILQKCSRRVMCGTQFKPKPADIYCISSKGMLPNASQMYVISFCKESPIHIRPRPAKQVRIFDLIWPVEAKITFSKIGL